MTKNIPNILTALRLLMVPFLGYFLFLENYTAGIILFAAGGATDVLDGYIARKYNLVTKWGKVFDPLADKLMQITALVLLTYHQFIPVIVPIIVVGKEFLMMLGGIMLYKKGKTVIGANWYGKMATVIFYFAILATIIFKMDLLINKYTTSAANISIGLAVLCTLFAFVMYVVIYVRISRNYHDSHSNTNI